MLPMHRMVPMAEGQKTPPTVKCRSFLHFRNLKHRNLSRLVLRQSVPMLCGFHRSLAFPQAIGVHAPTGTGDFSITFG